MKVGPGCISKLNRARIRLTRSKSMTRREWWIRGCRQIDRAGNQPRSYKYSLNSNLFVSELTAVNFIPAGYTVNTIGTWISPLGTSLKHSHLSA
jgi:hypothetical protein